MNYTQETLCISLHRLISYYLILKSIKGLIQICVAICLVLSNIAEKTYVNNVIKVGNEYTIVKPKSLENMLNKT